MILNEQEMGPLIQKVFTVYAAFWVTVLVVLFFAIGALTKKADKKRAAAKHH